MLCHSIGMGQGCSLPRTHLQGSPDTDSLGFMRYLLTFWFTCRQRCCTHWSWVRRGWQLTQLPRLRSASTQGFCTASSRPTMRKAPEVRVDITDS